ncbi:N-acetylmuramoyl-L-alanine amidase family protein [Sporomusa sphaeroides]|uniref:N-acetylmuramoyl-L-alanine amidase LytC n=1 Tax=Sporomusa sphaeroides DSM 2875 TaxID=1337886 RepID=A0ABM9WA19_9FIRM|nr:N-acetylmuramoyl-L-alanine amidase [Sporomusa sphaeroides]OLS54252.1 N-acetylmuramoyl-L-alanine amidase LytC precursor [Sporomusa sphaeroides DSM 2875]CVK21878.1 N-acetylmuramoyl-L-alanine amidase LytC precursor [Sporomusa sphaeroides DSM 2875]
MKIVIDPGHSGSLEPGACAGGVRECDVALAIAGLLAERLAEAGHAALLTRTGDIATDDLGFRAALANANRADVFVSIHANSVANPAAQGTEVYHYPGSVQGRRLAALLQARLVAELGTVDRGVKTANFQVLRQTRCPAALVEVAFISNEAERRLLCGYAGQLAAAVAMAEALTDYFAG